MFDVRYNQLAVGVIEDSAHTRTVIKKLLQQIGVRSVIEAEDGRTGIKEVIRTRPDIILCDIHMEPEDGLTFVTNLRRFRIPGIAKTPVIMLTADAAMETVKSFSDLRINGYLVKPVSLQVLKERLDKVLGFH
jgi:two-component system chemotaxis response regulator CheY